MNENDESKPPKDKATSSEPQPKMTPEEYKKRAEELGLKRMKGVGGFIVSGASGKRPDKTPSEDS